MCLDKILKTFFQRNLLYDKILTYLYDKSGSLDSYVPMSMLKI